MWQGDQFHALFTKATKTINAFWSEELSAELLNNHPTKVKQIIDADKNLEKWWGKDMDEFRKELVRLYHLHKEVADEYKGGEKVG